MVTGKPVNQFPTGNWFSERITGYRIYRMSRRHDPGNADGTVVASECDLLAWWVSMQPRTRIALLWPVRFRDSSIIGDQ